MLRIDGPNDAHVYHALSKQPISEVVWRKRDNLTLMEGQHPLVLDDVVRETLITMLLTEGWVAPVVILKNGTIVDGRAMYEVSDDARMRARYAGYLPTVTVASAPAAQRRTT